MYVTRNLQLIVTILLHHHFSIHPDMVEFDNSYSFLRSKKIWYDIAIEMTQDSDDSEDSSSDVSSTIRSYYGLQLAKSK